MNENVQPIYKPNVPAIVFTIDDGYVPYFSVALTGLLKNSSAVKNYDIVVLYRILSEANQEVLLKECQKYSNVSLRFYNIDELVNNKDKEKWVSNIAHINEVAYYRLYIPAIFAKYKKVIFLDADICIDGDVSELYDIDLQDNYLAAARGCMSVYSQVYSTCVDKSAYKFVQYVNDVLQIDDKNYFNAGVLVFNVAKILEDKKNEEFMAKLNIVSSLKYNDQDILNICCVGKVKYLGCEWNYCPKFTRINDKKQYDKMLGGKVKIYHYIGSDKPWLNQQRQFYNVFYGYAMLSPHWNFFVKQ